MATPQLGQAKVDKILSQFSQMYRNKVYIAEKILPTLTVKERSGKYAKYGKENLRTYTNQLLRAPGTRALQVDFSISQGNYVCTEKAIEKLVPDEFLNNTDDPYDPKRDATAFLMDNLWVNQEVALQAVMTSTATMTLNTTLSGTGQWSDYANSDPINDIETAIEAVRTATAQRPNVITMSRQVFLKLKYHPDIRAQLKYTNGGQLSDGEMGKFLADFFSLEEVIIGESVKNTSIDGQTDSISDVWGKDCWLIYRTPRPSLMNATFGLTLTDVPRLVDTYREEAFKSDVVRVRYSYDQNLFDVNLCYLIKNAIA